MSAESLPPTTEQVGWGTVITAYQRALPSGLDGLPLKSVRPVPLPEGHPDTLPVDPDEREFDRDLALMARAGRWMFARALWGDDDMKMAVARRVEDDELHTYNNTPGIEVVLHLVIDLAAFDLLGEDIAAGRAA